MSFESRPPVWVEIVRTLPSVITSLIAAAALFFSVGQWSQTQAGEQETRTQERFERAVVRLSSQSANERITGVALLRTFLRDRDPEYHDQTLSLLTHSLASEPNPTVQGAMVGLFKSLDAEIVNGQTLDNVLLELADMSRTVREQRELLATSKSIAVAITAVSSKGGHTLDLSNIYCSGCDFSTANLTMVDLRGADLSNADLTMADLRGADLREADIREANFYNTILFGTNLLEVKNMTAWQLSQSQTLFNARMSAAVERRMRSACEMLFVYPHFLFARSAREYGLPPSCRDGDA